MLMKLTPVRETDCTKPLASAHMRFAWMAWWNWPKRFVIKRWRATYDEMEKEEDRRPFKDLITSKPEAMVEKFRCNKDFSYLQLKSKLSLFFDLFPSTRGKIQFDKIEHLWDVEAMIHGPDTQNFFRQVYKIFVNLSLKILSFLISKDVFETDILKKLC